MRSLCTLKREEVWEGREVGFGSFLKFQTLEVDVSDWLSTKLFRCWFIN